MEPVDRLILKALHDRFGCASDTPVWSAPLAHRRPYGAPPAIDGPLPYVKVPYGAPPVPKFVPANAK